MVLGNLFRDQLDRYGETEALADEWAKTVAERAGRTRFALNADDPLVADLGRDGEGRPREGVVYFGIDDTAQALPELQHAFDAKHCRRCGHPYAYARAFVGHLGHYSCPSCGAESARSPTSRRPRIELHGMRGSSLTVRTPAGELAVELPLPGLYNVYNALAAIAAGLELGVAPERIAPALKEMRGAFGRVETVAVGAKQRLDPAGQEPGRGQRGPAHAKLEATGGELDLWIALNDRIADGRDVSWIWDADFELLAAPCGGSPAPAPGRRRWRCG